MQGCWLLKERAVERLVYAKWCAKCGLELFETQPADYVVYVVQETRDFIAEYRCRPACPR